MKKMYCPICQKEHSVRSDFFIPTTRIYRKREVTFKACFYYCAKTKQSFETEELVEINNAYMKYAYEDLLEKDLFRENLSLVILHYAKEKVMRHFDDAWMGAQDILRSTLPADDKMLFVLNRYYLEERTLNEFACKVAEHCLLRFPDEKGSLFIEAKKRYIRNNIRLETLMDLRDSIRGKGKDTTYEIPLCKIDDYSPKAKEYKYCASDAAYYASDPDPEIAANRAADFAMLSVPYIEDDSHIKEREWQVNCLLEILKERYR